LLFQNEKTRKQWIYKPGSVLTAKVKCSPFIYSISCLMALSTYPPAQAGSPQAPVYMVFQLPMCTAGCVATAAGRLLPYLLTLTGRSRRLFSSTRIYPRGYLSVRKRDALRCPDFPLVAKTSGEPIHCLLVQRGKCRNNLRFNAGSFRKNVRQKANKDHSVSLFCHCRAEGSPWIRPDGTASVPEKPCIFFQKAAVVFPQSPCTFPEKAGAPFPDTRNPLPKKPAATRRKGENYQNHT
jgi:hypothetical protein